MGWEEKFGRGGVGVSGLGFGVWGREKVYMNGYEEEEEAAEGTAEEAALKPIVVAVLVFVVKVVVLAT